MAPNAAMGRASPISESIWTRRAYREDAAMVERVGEWKAGIGSTEVDVGGGDGPMPDKC